MKPTALTLAALLLAAGGLHTARAGARTQSPDAPWRTIPTAHYRIHHPDRPEFAAFARAVASRIEGIHALLEREVGYALPGPTDVIVQNPAAAANGMVMPFLERPTVTLWTEPVPSDTEISHQHDFVDVLLLHELVHLHHLTRPDRSPTFLERLNLMLRTSRITQKAPAWIIEGYATYLEGRLTGQGRPHGAYRAMVLRQKAREGMLPTYRELNGVDLNVLSGIRYQAGSAFMEWLADHHPRKAAVWPDLWVRLSSRRYPGFASAFKATFGDEPEVLYGRYRAELTHTALELERRLTAAGIREGALWSQAPDGFLAYLSVSPDGSSLLARAVTRDRDRAGLQVYFLGEDGPRARQEAEHQAKLRKKDPDLPAETPSARRSRDPEYTLASRDFSTPDRPRWEADGTISFDIGQRNAEGVFHRTRATWKPRALPARTPTILHVHPVQKEGRWSVELGGRSVVLPLEPFGPVAHDTVRDVVYVAATVDGIYNLVRLSCDPATGALGRPEVLTRTLAGALYPAPTPDGKSLYYAQVSARGSQVRCLDLALGPLPDVHVDPEAAPFVRDAVLSRADESSRVPAPVEPPPGKPYAVGDSHALSMRIGMVLDPSSSAYQLGAGGSDVLGRLNWTVMGSVPLPGTHAKGPAGGMGGLAWRGWSWSPSLHLFSSLARPSVRSDHPVAGLDQERRGGELAITREWWPSNANGRLILSTARERITDPQQAAGGRDRTAHTASLQQDLQWNRHRTVLAARASLLAQSGRTEERTWTLSRGQVDLSGGLNGWSLQLQGAAGRITGHPAGPDLFSLGGQATGLVPRSLEANAVFQPALPTCSATGDRFQRWRAGFEGLLWVEGTRVWNDGSPRPAFTRVAGFELMDAVEDALPFTREAIQRYLGRAELRLSLMRPLDGVMKGRTVVSLGLIQRF